MDDLRSVVEGAVRDVRAERDALERTMRRVRSRQRNRRIRAGATALVLTVAATAIVWRAFLVEQDITPAAPEGGRIVFTTQRPGDPSPVIAVMTADGSDVRILGPGWAPAWSPDGTLIAFSRSGPNRSAGILVMNSDGSDVRELTSNPEGIFDEGPSWSPDGRSIVFSRSALDLSGPDPLPAGNSHRDLYSVAVDGTGLTKLLGGPTDDFNPSWSPDGGLIAFVRIVDPVASSGPERVSQIWTVHPDGAGATQLTSSVGGASRPSWAPDGSALAFDDAGDNIYIIGADGAGLRRLELPSGWGEEAESPFDPAWSPDGSRIAFAAGGEQGHDIFVVDVGGTNLERLTGPDGQDNEPSWAEPLDVSATSSASPTATATPAPSTVCFESESSGDFDGDGRIDTATLHALVPFDRCTPEALETDWRFELMIELRSANFSVPFADCESLFDCELLEGSDFDGDGRSELPVMLSMAATSFTGVYRVTETDVRPIELAAPGDPGFLKPGPIRLGGGQDAIQQAGFECQVQDDGSRVVIAWIAERDDAVSPFRVHLTTLELRGDEFVVVAMENQENVTDLPALHGICEAAS